MRDGERIKGNGELLACVGAGGIAPPEIHEKLLRSSAWRVYQRAFLSTTRLPLHLESIDGTGESSENGNRFCRLVNRDFACSCTRCPLSRLGDGHLATGSSSIAVRSCGAGLWHAAIPVRMGKHPVARLVTGQVATSRPSIESFVVQASPLWLKFRADELSELGEAFLLTPVISRKECDQAIALVAAFAVQLGGRINRILIEDEAGDRRWVKRARETLRESATSRTPPPREPEIPESWFRRFAGLGFDEFRERCRLEQACCRLLDPAFPRRRIADASGYRSESELEAAFLTYLGDAPDAYRTRMLVNDRLLAAWPDFPGDRNRPLTLADF